MAYNDEPIIAKAGSDKEYVLCPTGVHPAVCVDVVNLGELWNTQGHKFQPKIEIIFQVALDEESAVEEIPIVRKRFTLSLHKKATLRAFLESWRGRAFTDEEAQGFDVRKLLAAPAFVNVVHNSVNDKTYANIASVMPLPKGMPKPVATDYVRVCDRENAKTPEEYAREYNAKFKDEIDFFTKPKAQAAVASAASNQVTDADIPF